MTDSVKKHVYSLKWDVGAHTAFNGRICDALWTGINYGMYTIQIFMGNPKGFNRSTISEEDLESCNDILTKFPTHVFTHFPYIANLAGSKNILAWDGDEEQDTKTKKVIQSLEYELNIVSHFTSRRSGVVIHPGNHVNTQSGLLNIAKTINMITFSPGAKLILENTAGQGTSLARNLDEIKVIIDNVDEEKREHIGVCIDTCHLYAYGDYDLSKISEVKRFFDEFDEKLGIDRFTLLHLNDSQCPMKSRKDRHACLGDGLIWGDGFESLIYLLDLCQKHDIPMVLETHGLDMITLACLP